MLASRLNNYVVAFLSLATRLCTAAPHSYQPRVPFTIFTTDSMTGTSINTPTTVASAAHRN